MFKQRKRLGLALAGGVMRGRAHVGVIQVLEQAGIEVSFLSGVSAGAIVGATYAVGLDAGRLAEMAKLFSWPRIAKPSVLNPFRSGLARLGLLDFQNLEMLLIRSIGDVTFAELARPLAIGATDLITGERIVITSGRVAHAVRASSSVPGVVTPARWRGRLLCDGFASNNVPIQILRDMGADVVLAVNIMPVARHVPSNLFWAGSTAVSALVLQAGDPLDLADILIEPDLAEIDYLFPNLENVLARGRAATQAILPQLKALLT
jgi:NTE family protein